MGKILRITILLLISLGPVRSQDLKFEVEEANKLVVYNRTELTVKIVLEKTNDPLFFELAYILPGAEPELFPGNYYPREVKALRVVQDYDVLCFLLDLVRAETVAQAQRRGLNPNLNAIGLQQQASRVLADTPLPAADSLMVRTIGGRPLQQWIDRMENLDLPQPLEGARETDWKKNLLFKVLEVDQLLDQSGEEGLKDLLLKGLETLVSGTFFKIVDPDVKRPRKATFPNISFEAGLHQHLRLFPGEKHNADYKDLGVGGYTSRVPYYLKLFPRFFDYQFCLLYERFPLLINQKRVEGGYLDENEGMTLTFGGLGVGSSWLYQWKPRTHLSATGILEFGDITEKRYELSFQNNQLGPFKEIRSSGNLAFAFEGSLSLEIRGYGLTGGFRLFNYGNTKNKKKFIYYLMVQAGIYIPLYRFDYR